MNDIDLELKTRAKTETDPVPAGFEGRLQAKLNELPEAAAHKRARPRFLRPALIAAVLAVALLIPVCASAWQGWLEPVVSYGDNGALIEEYTVAVNATREGSVAVKGTQERKRCDVTLENLVTDGRAVYCLFSAEYDEDFDFNAALDRACWSIDRPSWMTPGTVAGQSFTFFRVDDRSQPGKAEFIAQLYMDYGMTMYYFDEDGVWNRESVDSLLGRVLTVFLHFPSELPWNPDEEEYPGASYKFEDIQFNDTIDLVEVEWDDGHFAPDGTKCEVPTRMVVSPLSVYIDCPHGPVVEMLPEEAPEVDHWTFGRMAEEAFARWKDTDWIKKYDVKLALADGTHLKLSGLPRSSPNGGTLGASSVTQEVKVWLKSGVLFPELRRPETVTALIINGVRYDVADAVG